MPWNHVLPAGVLIVIGVIVILNAEWLGRNIRSMQQRHLPFARTDEQIDQPGLLGPMTPRKRAWAVRGAGILFLVMAGLVLLNGLTGFTF